MAAEAMDPIVITAPRLERPLLDTPAVVDRVDRRELGQGRLGVDNVTGEHSIANVRINANGGLYFDPAPERTFTAAVELGF
jgi:hypothetical protein